MNKLTKSKKYHMTYKELLEKLKSATPEQLKQNVTVYLAYEEEYHYIQGIYPDCQQSQTTTSKVEVSPSLLTDLLEWARLMGGWDAPIWKRVAAAAAAIKQYDEIDTNNLVLSTERYD